MIPRGISTQQESPRIYSVSQLTRDIKTLLETKYPAVRVEGEISNFRLSPTGHAYFSLKDEFCQMSAVIFRSQLRGLSAPLKDGMRVVLSGSIGLYERRGEYQIIVSRVEEKGVGALQIAFEKLKRKLFEEGLFRPEHKKPIPLLPRRIGVVTSPTGAAIRDILNVLERRFSNLHIILNPVRVQGYEAAGEIATAISDFSRMSNVDVIIVGRGGGSLEDLWAFNEEVVARAIYASKIPIISAVGHEIDWTISDFVADVRAPTPSAAAELVIGRKDEMVERISAFRDRLYHYASALLADSRRRVDIARQSYVFRQPGDLVKQYRQQVDELLDRLSLLCRHHLEISAQKVQSLGSRLESLNPESVLARGYSITLDIANGTVIYHVAQAEMGREVRTLVRDGSFISRVSDVRPGGATWRTKSNGSSRE
ncbi:exodeoxyribonuclease VII large subunit [bacterium]|nr:exodeoxyribonuclease VII large subunit [bacterium]